MNSPSKNDQVCAEGLTLLTQWFGGSAALLATLMLLLATAGRSLGEVPHLLNFQGRVAAAGVPFNGTGLFKFALVSATGNATYWSNDGSSVAGAEPTASVSLAVSKGLYSILLGDTALPNITAIPAAVFANGDVRVRVWFDDGVNGAQLLSPDQRIAAVAYAVMAETADTVADGAITSAKIAPGAVGAGQLAAGAAAANLASAGHSPIASGGIVLSATDNAALVGVGYVRMGSTTFAESWLQRTNGAPPSTRHSATAVWTGSELIVWGGTQGSSTYLDTGGRYNPSLNTWSQLPTAGAPGPRKIPASVWTGTEMIVWGGRFDQLSPPFVTYLNDGARYNPVSDTWTPVSSTGAPAPRSSHSLVWTGTEMIAWGGEHGANAFWNDGGRYNPATDSWTPVSTVGAPGNRYVHSAVWTGEKMLIWGGVADNVADSSVTRYDPAADTWTPGTTTGQPDPRFSCSVIWSGTELIVWGGYFDDTIFNYGKRYNPTADVWTPMAAVGAPSIRLDHSAVWTGTEMIVWGGRTRVYKGVFNDGGRYDPSQDKWTPMSSSSAAPPRRSHSAVWTGSEMLVFGGLGGSFPTDDSAYLPAPLNDTWSFSPGRLLHLYVRP